MSVLNPDLGPILRDKVCFVSGGSRALGASIASRLAAYGAQVSVTYFQSQSEAQALCDQIKTNGGKAEPIYADVTQAHDVEQSVATIWQRYGAIDIAVNAVGPYVDSPFLEMPTDDFDRIIAGNIRSTFLLCQALGRRMRERGSGQIINIAATDYVHRSHSVYGLAKQGVIYLTEALALELAPHVRINAIAPDLIADNEDMSSAISDPAIAATPLGRLVTRNEVAEALCTICSPAFAMMTGQCITLDGGRAIPRIALGKQ